MIIFTLFSNTWMGATFDDAHDNGRYSEAEAKSGEATLGTYIPA